MGVTTGGVLVQSAVGGPQGNEAQHRVTRDPGRHHERIQVGPTVNHEPIIVALNATNTAIVSPLPRGNAPGERPEGRPPGKQALARPGL